jgi:hypothetical protein
MDCHRHLLLPFGAMPEGRQVGRITYKRCRHPVEVVDHANYSRACMAAASTMLSSAVAAALAMRMSVRWECPPATPRVPS